MTPRPLALAAAVALAGSLVAGAAPATTPRPRLHGIERLQHVVIIDLENRSFDHLYGEFPGADGLANAKHARPQVDANGKPYETLPVPKDGKVPPGLPNAPFRLEPYYAMDEKMPDLSHAWDDERFQIHGGRMDRFVLGNSQRATAMGYYRTGNLPLARLAAQYTLCDRFFHSAIGGSMLSHVWLIAARTARWPDAPDSVRLRHDAAGKVTHNGFVTEDGWMVNTCQARLGPHDPKYADSVLVPGQDFETIGDRLSEKGITWAWYAEGWNDALAGRAAKTYQYHHQPFPFFTRYGPGTPGRSEHLLDGEDFLRAAREGTLPAVAFVKPLGEFNEHPGYADLLSGERHTLELIRAVMDGPQWDSTAVIVTYDEHGGYWDHVTPPVFDEWGPGTRIPTLVISPFAKRGFVDHTVYDGTSILALIEKRWKLAPLSRRDARANPLRGAFAF